MDIVGTVDDGFVEVTFVYDVVVGTVYLCVDCVGSEMERVVVAAVVVVAVVAAVIVETPSPGQHER